MWTKESRRAVLVGWVFWVLPQGSNVLLAWLEDEREWGGCQHIQDKQGKNKSTLSTEKCLVQTTSLEKRVIPLAQVPHPLFLNYFFTFLPCRIYLWILSQKTVGFPGLFFYSLKEDHSWRKHPKETTCSVFGYNYSSEIKHWTWQHPLSNVPQIAALCTLCSEQNYILSSSSDLQTP